MKRVLNRLGYCNEQGIIDIKGKIACLLELDLTELLFDGVFVDMTVAHVCCYIELFCN
jgi:ATP-dependent RNA helicase DOB1